MSVSARDIAAELRQRLPGLGATQLQKLLYYSQGHHLAAFEQPLFREKISAWDKGPVVGALWHAESVGAEPDEVVQLDEAALNTVGYVVSRYGGLSARDLVNLSHAEDPWRLADEQRPPGGSVTISLESLRAFFSEADDEGDSVPVSREEIRGVLVGANERLEEPAQADSLEALRRRLDSSAG